MIDDKLLCELYHSITIYCMSRGLPHLVKLPDLIQAIVDGNKELAKRDAGSLAVECVVALTESYLNDVFSDDKEYIKEMENKISIIRDSLVSAKTADEMVKVKTVSLDLLNQVLNKMGHPSIRGLNEAV